MTAEAKRLPTIHSSGSDMDCVHLACQKENER